MRGAEDLGEELCESRWRPAGSKCQYLVAWGKHAPAIIKNIHSLGTQTLNCGYWEAHPPTPQQEQAPELGALGKPDVRVENGDEKREWEEDKHGCVAEPGRDKYVSHDIHHTRSSTLTNSVDIVGEGRGGCAS